MASAILLTCSSLSITQGPASKTRRAGSVKSSKRIAIAGLLFRFGQQRGHLARQTVFAIPVRRADERPEQRMRLQRFRLELRMKLAAEIIRMVRNLADLHVRSV